MSSPDLPPRRSIRRLALATIFPGFAGSTEAPAWLHAAIEDGLGGVLLFGRNIDPARGDDGVAHLTADLRANAPNLLVATDEEGGDVTRLDASSGSSFPGNAALGAVDDPELTRAVALELGLRLRRCGVDIDLAPVADVDANPHNPVIGVRSFGYEPTRVADHVAAFVDGLQTHRVAATAKHFPGHGATSEDSHLTTPVVDAPRDVLDTRELVPFRAAIDADVKVIMTAHLRALAIDPDRPATVSPDVITGLLRNRLGYDGVVMSDGLDMHAISRTLGQAEGAVQALAAGVDALCVGGDSVDGDVVEEIVEAIIAAVESGRVSIDRLAEAARRVHALQTWTRGPVSAEEEGPAVTHAGVGTTATTISSTTTKAAARTAAEAVAERALLIGGDVVLDRPPLVIELHDRPSLAAGHIPWGVGHALRERMPDTVVVERTKDTAADLAELDDHPDRPVVVAVRGTRRRPWQVDLVHRVRVMRPDVVVVDHGVPSTPEVLGSRYVVTHGAARVAAVAAARAMTTVA